MLSKLKRWLRHPDAKEVVLLTSIVLALLLLFIFLAGRAGEGSKSKSRIAKPAPPKVKPYTFPGGETQLMPNYRFVALYGTPGNPALGALGEQDAAGSIQRVKALAADYQPYSTEPVFPTLELITTIASSTPTDNGDYSQEVDLATLNAWVQAARSNGTYVVLDLQPGRSDFLSQAKQYQSLLEQPNVGLALDPEWRLGPDQVPLAQIGSVSIDEINQTFGWLADLTAQKKLPQKLVVLHEFRLDMIPDRDKLDTSHKNLAYILQMDGQGAQNVKIDTWNAVTAGLPAGVQPGWKNFYHQDNPVLDPAGTMALTPKPWYVSYQ